MPRNRSRSRSKSPATRRKERDNRENRERERTRKRNRSRDRHNPNGSSRRYSRSPSDRHNHRDSSRDRRDKLQGSSKGCSINDRPVVTAADLAGKTEDEQNMMKMMGFCNFDTTKGKKVEGNEVGDVHVILKRKYRQYMNRKGGFNRPLDFVA